MIELGEPWPRCVGHDGDDWTRPPVPCQRPIRSWWARYCDRHRPDNVGEDRPTQHRLAASADRGKEGE